jgi:hypothetical protein
MALAGFISVGVNAQDYGCAADENLQQMLDSDPVARANYVENQEAFNLFAANYSASRADAEYIIPCVVHVLYNTCEGNISLAQIEDGIRLINEDFGRTNPDTNLTRSQFLPFAANTGVEFRLARIDPDGDPTDGVVRIETSQAVGAQNNVKGISRWSSSHYMNIWIVESIANFTQGQGTILGYAQFPGSGSWTTYGLVVRNDAFGTIGTSNADGRTVTHEIGHCLNLGHTFQNGCGSSCAFSGDNVCDTPPANSNPTYNCSFTTNTCSNDAAGGSAYSSNVPDMIENYMSYNSCQNLFTEGQKTRMISALEFYSVLGTLVSEDNLRETGVLGLVEADFETEHDILCQFEPMTFSNTSFFTGEAQSWTFGGEAMPGESTESNPAVIFPYAGLQSVTYVATDGDSTAETTQSVFVASNEGHYAPYTDDMEDLVSLPDDRWFTRNIDQDEHVWKVSNEAAYSGEQSIKLDNFGKCGSRIDELISQSFDFSPFSSVNVSFKVAFARTTEVNSCYLRMYSSKDCGKTWLLNWAKSTTQLQSVSTPVGTPFIPADESEWKNYTVSLTNSAYMVEGAMLKFEFGGEGGNNLYLDDVQFNGTFDGVQLLRAPEDGKTGMASDVLIDWKSAGFVETYEYEIDASSNFDSQNKITGTTTFIDATPHNEDTEFLAEGLDVATTYYWRVRYVQGGSSSAWSDTWSFTVSESGVGVKEETIADVAVFPNPSNGALSMTSTLGMDRVFVLDYTGRQVLNIYGNGTTQMAINLDVPAGLYIVQITTTDGAVHNNSVIIR